MSLHARFWWTLFDPVVKRLERRIEHHQSLRSITHDGATWRTRASIGKGCVFYPEAVLSNPASAPKDLVIGDHCHVRGEIAVTGGRFSIGHHGFVGPGSRIWCSQTVSIGNHVLVSHLVDIHDSDSHSNSWQERRRETVMLFEKLVEPERGSVGRAAVVIEDDVWIGFKTTILKGVTVGRGAIVAAGSVVTRDVAPFTVVAGNPARVVRTL